MRCDEIPLHFMTLNAIFRLPENYARVFYNLQLALGATLGTVCLVSLGKIGYFVYTAS